MVKASLTRGQETALAVASVCTLPVVAYSEFALAVTGCGLPPGPNGLFGAVEGVSYLVLVTVIGLSAWLKVKTGSGLPPGPGGLLGAMEGFAYLLLLAGLADAAYVVYTYGSLPPAVPTEGSRCFVP